MKTKRRLIVTLVLCCCMALLGSCKKEDGPMGPQGPEGQIGAKGPRGQKGDVGPKGDKGDRGVKGDHGDQGAPGDIGGVGDKGDNGNTNVKSTGWVVLPSEKWQVTSGSGGTDFSAPGDLGVMAASAWVSLISTDSDGVVLVYVDDGKGVRMCKFQRTVSGGGKTGAVEFRFAHGNTDGYAKWLSPVVALRSGQWDTNHMRNTYLPSLKWKAVVIRPADMGSLNHIDVNNYELVKQALKLPD